ncbi:DUF397 domain-containing protein [Kitasatospora xanthocidica]|uniref:DUF397 domain-containing protein n=1 Tax=Kitasatospora xanthocidica TaxID=83382 RepID=A0A372ZQA6_9ACTN|nr:MULTISPECIES: DUF397 domain-containing protein [Kitasatospora]RGD57590.1 DUF397 domain-containing protein [Kitasatospora xanthocidica]
MIETNRLYSVPLDNVLWHKSSYTANNGNCVELATVPGLPAVAIRDSKNPEIPALRSGAGQVRAFILALAADTLVEA